MTSATLEGTTTAIKYFENNLFIVDPSKITPYSKDWQQKSKYLGELFAKRKRERQLSR